MIRLCTINLRILKYLTYVVTYFLIFIISDLIHTSNVITVHEYREPFPDEDILRVMTLFSRKNITLLSKFDSGEIKNRVTFKSIYLKGL